jgi:SSS family transporter
MNLLDLAVVVVYIVGCTAAGALLGRSATGLKGYFLGESQVPTWAVMLSIVATETSTATFLSVPGISYAKNGNFTYLQLPLGYILGRILVSIVLMPLFFQGEILTAYDVLNRRFGGATKTVASFLFLVTRTLGDGLRLFLAALVLRELGRQAGLFESSRAWSVPEAWSMPAAIILMGATTIVYTYLGGMKAVVWTDVAQFFVYILGALAALGILIAEIPGGWNGLLDFGRDQNKFTMFDFAFDLTRPYTFWAGVGGGMILNTATHGADQLMVQRYLAARSIKDARVALVTSGVVVFLQFALFLLIGVGLAALYEAKPPTVSLQRDGEFTYFLTRYLPSGLLGLVVAAIFAAAMSTLSSSLNASSAASVNDFYRPFFRAGRSLNEAEETHLLRVSKGLTIVWGVAQMAVAYLAFRLLTDNVVNNALAIASFVTGIVLGLFALGVLTQRVGQGAALIGLLAGLVAVSYAKFGPLLNSTLYPFDGAIAWPWYALVGSSTVFAVGLLASSLLPRSSSAFPVAENPRS